MASLVVLQDANAQSNLKLLEVKDDLLMEKINQVAILNKYIDRLSEKRPNVLDELDFLGASKAEIQHAQSSASKPESSSKKARI
ncbi:MAG: hypothetical protein U1E78_12335 [Gammaproteobacteria bacterium]